MILNLTPHVVRVYDADLSLRAEIAPAGYVPRLREARTLVAPYMLGGYTVPVYRVARDQLAEPLPAGLLDGVTAVIVGVIVADAVKAAVPVGVRVFTPDTGPGRAVRRDADGTLSAQPNARGDIVGVLGFVEV
jgi:hypothetical protein